MKSGMKRGLLIGGGGILLAAIVVANVSKGQGGRLGVQVEDVKVGDLSSTVRAPAKVQPETMVKLSANVPGEVVELAVKEGDSVRKGQFLLRLDAAQYQAQLRQSQAALDAAKSSLRLSEVSLEQSESLLKRKESLFERKLVSPEEIETARTQRNTDKARVDVNREEVARSEAAVQSAQDNLRKTVFHSPIDGTVTQLNVERGEIVMVGTMNNPGTVILRVADLRRMKVEADVDETDVASIRLGQTATVKVDALPDTTLAGRVAEIANSPKVSELGTQEQQTNFVVDVMIDQPPPTLRPGMTADVEIKTATKKNILHVPIQAVVVRTEEELAKAKAGKPGRARKTGSATAAETASADPSGKKGEEVKGVFVMGNGEAQFRKVRTGIASDTDLEVSGDLKANEKVIVGPNKVLRQLKPGSRVKLEEPKAKKGEKR
ncbi:MAG: efflux RND transporter periplasmic adaptor subunit [Candidatus Eisenbacteria bacterium]|uniref:Efflux RND transporter periplasmic adaptor subunit n=1 Tax=Eiseniibacteriota bacterium TaxID=2212470 RepID=A0A538T880_UNCEI|nr:MAG: efflux RND transporter periplasmic adaptor subunit [Candidatus Eisenbacteria bacterium]